MIKNIILAFLFAATSASFSYAQNTTPNDQQRKSIQTLIDQYSQARENRDTVLLKKILTGDIDQLVSTGEWRRGMSSAVQGMLNSSASNPGTRTLAIESIRLLDQKSCIVDCRYIIKNSGGDTRTMWSTFVVVMENGTWKISAIRNMAPSGPVR